MVKNKNQSKLSSVLSKIRTPKGRLFATLTSFVVIGAGIMVFRSFAATPVWISTINQHPGNELSHGSAGTTVCPTSKAYDAGWKFDVAVLSCKQYESIYYAGAYNKPYRIPSNGNYMACAWFKGASKAVTINMIKIDSRITGGYQTIASKSYPVFNNSSYTYKCTSPVYLRTGNAIEANVKINSDPSSASFISVASVNIERL